MGRGSARGVKDLLWSWVCGVAGSQTWARQLNEVYCCSKKPLPRYRWHCQGWTRRLASCTSSQGPGELLQDGLFRGIHTKRSCPDAGVPSQSSFLRLPGNPEDLGVIENISGKRFFEALVPLLDTIDSTPKFHSLCTPLGSDWVNLRGGDQGHSQINLIKDKALVRSLCCSKTFRLPTAFRGLFKLKLAQKDHITNINIMSDSFPLLSTQMFRTPNICLVRWPPI